MLRHYEMYETLSQTQPVTDQRVHYMELPPAEKVHSYVACYSYATSQISIEPSILHQVIPDGCVNIVFNLNHPSDRYGFVTPPLKRTILVPLTGQVQLIGIRFLPGTAPCFLHDHISSFDNQTVGLEDIVGHSTSQNLACQLDEETTIENRIALLNTFVTSRLMEYQDIDMTIHRTLYLIYANKGNISVSELAQHVQISPRHLRRKFEAWIGMSPKTLCRILRFQSVFGTLSRYPTCNPLSAALDSGYYDQSHFLQDFRLFHSSFASQAETLADRE